MPLWRIKQVYWHLINDEHKSNEALRLSSWRNHKEALIRTKIKSSFYPQHSRVHVANGTKSLFFPTRNAKKRIPQKKQITTLCTMIRFLLSSSFTHQSDVREPLSSSCGFVFYSFQCSCNRGIPRYDNVVSSELWVWLMPNWDTPNIFQILSSEAFNDMQATLWAIGAALSLSSSS